MSNALCRYEAEFRGCTLVVCLYSMWQYVIIVGCVRVCTNTTDDDNDIRPHTVQTHNERTSTEFSLITA